MIGYVCEKREDRGCRGMLKDADLGLGSWSVKDFKSTKLFHMRFWDVYHSCMYVDVLLSISLLFEQGLFPSHNLPLNPFSASAFWSYDQRCANDVMWAAKSEIHFSTIYPSKPYQIVTVDLYGFCCRPRGSYCIYLWFVRMRRIKMKATQNGTCLGVPGHKQCKQCMLDWVYWVLVLISGYHLSQHSHERLWKGGRESSCEPWHPVEPELISLSAYEPRSSLKVSWGASDLFRVREQLKATSRCFERSHSDPFATPMP